MFHAYKVGKRIECFIIYMLQYHRKIFNVFLKNPIGVRSWRGGAEIFLEDIFGAINMLEIQTTKYLKKIISDGPFFIYRGTNAATHNKENKIKQ